MSEERIRREVPDLYDTIAPWVPLLPDMRPQGTIRLMKNEPHTTSMNWRLIEMELEALSTYGREDDAKLMNAIFSGDRNTVLEFLKKKHFLEDFFLTYRGLIWIAIRVAPESTILTLVLSARKLDLLPSYVKEQDLIPWITDLQMAKIIYERDPQAIELDGLLLIEWAKNGELGYILWTAAASLLNLDIYREILFISGQYGHLYIVKTLIENTMRYRQHTEKNVLLGALKGNQPHIVSYLLKNNFINRMLMSKALIEASERGQIQIVELLLDYGGDPTIEAGESMRRAIKNGYTNIMERLVASSHVYDAKLGSMFHEAIYKKNYEIAKVILDSGKLSKDWIFSTLSLAERQNNYELVDFLEDYLID